MAKTGGNTGMSYDWQKISGVLLPESKHSGVYGRSLWFERQLWEV